MEKKMDPVLLADDIAAKALKKGCDSAEVYIKTAKRLSVEAKDNAIEALESSRDLGISLKVIKNQRQGFSFTTAPESIDDMIDKAVRSADWTAEDKYIDIPEYSPASQALVLDEKIRDIKEDDVIKNALSLERSALDLDARIRKVRKAELGLSIGSTTIFNSKGVNISYESAYMTAELTLLASDGRDSQMGWDFAVSRRPGDIDLESIARRAGQRAVSLLGAKKISNVKVPVILDPSVACDFLSILSSSVSADAVQKKRSFLYGKAGKKIISPLINIIDDGVMPWGTGTKPVDDEGVPTVKKTIVSAGTLTGYIHNTYTAKKQGVESTGNASRGSFRGLPGIAVTNFYIEPKQNEKWEMRNRKENKLIKSVSKGLLILDAMGVHTANHVSGDFSVGISGLWIENGEIKYPVKEAVMSGNILELFNRVEAVGDDLRFYGSTGSPGLLIGEVDISA